MFRFSLALLVGLSTAGIGEAASWAEGLFDELARDFGPVQRGPSLHHNFRVTNKTNVLVRIASVRVSCGCVSASALQHDLAPGQSTVIQASMDTTRFTGPKSVTIYVQFDRPQWEEVALVVSANGRDDFTITPDTLAFGPTRRGTSPTHSVTISFFGNNQWRILDAKSDSNYVKPTLRELRRDHHDVSYQLSATIRSDIPVGKWYTDIWLRTNNAGTPRIRVPLTVEVEPTLSVSPAVTHLGEVKTGETVDRKVIVRGDKPFRIVGVKGGDAQFSVNHLTAESKTIHVVTISLKPSKTGEQTWSVKLQTDMREQPEVDLHARAEVIP